MSLQQQPGALECTLYRDDPHSRDGEERELGDACILFDGPFEPPLDWDSAEREAYFEGEDPALFVCARIEAEGFSPEPGDYVAVVEGVAVQMYFIHAEQGERWVLLREELEL